MFFRKSYRGAYTSKKSEPPASVINLPQPPMVFSVDGKCVLSTKSCWKCLSFEKHSSSVIQLLYICFFLGGDKLVFFSFFDFPLFLFGFTSSKKNNSADQTHWKPVFFENEAFISRYLGCNSRGPDVLPVGFGIFRIFWGNHLRIRDPPGSPNIKIIREKMDFHQVNLFFFKSSQTLNNSSVYLPTWKP